MARARKKKKPLSNLTIIIGFAAVAGLAALVAGLAWLLIRVPEPPPVISYPSSRVADILAELTAERLSAPPLDQAGKLFSTEKRQHSSGVFYTIVWKGGSDTSLILAEKAIEDAWSGTDYGLKVAVSYPQEANGPRVRMVAALAGKALLEVVLERQESPGTGSTPGRGPGPSGRHQGRIAIVIDDVGNDLHVLDSLLAIGVPLTYSILPYSEHADQVCPRLVAAGAQVMLHLPMEPANYPETDPGEGALLLNMSPEEIRARLESALARVPCALGVNNHMGSAFTADSKAMSPVLAVIQERGLFFIDSRTTTETVAYSLARKAGIPSGERRIFLDHDPRPESIRSKLAALADLAAREGSAIGIGHPYPETIGVLEEELPKMEQLGWTFIRASEGLR